MNDNTPDIAQTARHWIIRMASGNMTEAELEQFHTWRKAAPEHEKEFQKECKLWRSLTVSPTQAQAVRLTWHRKTKRRRLKTAFVSFTVLAASFAVIFYAPLVKLWLQADQWTGTTIQTISLEDGSRVVLDSESALSIQYTPTQRHITLLRGNAFFDVKHDPSRPFQVTASTVTINDVGTQFEVRNDHAPVTITVKEGIVDVAAPHEASVRLRAHERLAYQHTTPPLIEHNLNPDDIAAWSHGELVLENATVADAVTILSRYHKGAVYLLGSAPSTTRISGIFRSDQTNDALTTIAATAKLKMRTFSKYIVVLE